MQKTLIIVSHPNIENSVINKCWISALRKHPELFTVHELYKVYPDKNIDIVKEQKLVEAHGNLIFQFPMYWFNCTPLLKQWLDDVLTYGWAYGSNGNKLQNKKIALAVSLGITEDGFFDPFTLASFLRSFEAMAHYVKADFQPPFCLYGASTEPGRATITPEKISQSADDYLSFLKKLI